MSVQTAKPVEVPVTIVTRDNDVTATAAEAVFTNSDDGSKPRAEVVIIRPGQNRSTGGKAKFYSAEAIKQAVATGFWKGAPMFVDHGTDEKMPKKRSARDLVGAISDTDGEVWLGQEGEARAMVDFFNPDWASFAERAAKHIGISNNADVRGRRYRDSATGALNFQVDEFTNRHSVDWVAFPSAGGGVAQFITASESEDDMGVDWTALTADMLTAHRPDLVTEIVTAAESDGTGDDDGDEKDEKEPVPASMTPDAIKALVAAEVRTATEAVVEQTSKQAAVRAKVATKLASSGLKSPKTLARIAAAFDGSVEYVEETVQEAIDEAKAELVENGVRTGPKPSEFGAGGGTASDDKPTVNLAQESVDGAPALSFLMKSVIGGSKANANTTGKGN